MVGGISTEIIDNCAILRLNNPPANAWDAHCLDELSRMLDELDQNPEIFSLILTGWGDKFFSAGADLNQFDGIDKGEAFSRSKKFADAFEKLSNFRGVTIAAINGYAMGGGLESALACDIRVVEEQVIMALPEARVGLLPSAGGTQLLPALVGEGWAKLMILCGEKVDASTAHQIGLVEKVVTKGSSMEVAKQIAESVAKQSPSSVKACKKLIQHARGGHSKDALPIERESFANLFDTLDQKEGVQAFLEKRKPIWKNS